MVSPNNPFHSGLTFDDLLLRPDYADFSRSDVVLKTSLTRNIQIDIPLLSSPMDTVTESSLAIALAEKGGMGIIHRNLSIDKQAEQVLAVKKAKRLVGGAIGVGEGYIDRARALLKAGADIILVDSAHGYAKSVIEAVAYLKNHNSKIELIAGNVATYEGAKALIKAGADAIRVGMGPGAICTTRIISGMGVPQVTALQETVRAARSTSTPIIADGGIKYSGDIVKALALGASCVMMGSFFASCVESPGETVELDRAHVPHRFQSIFSKGRQTFIFKQYRGMGSIGAMEQGVKVKSEDEYHGKSYKDRVLIAEGVEGLVPVKGTVSELVDQALGGIQSGMYYVGAKTLVELAAKAKFIKITQASLSESHPHDVLITNPGENY